MLQNTKELKSYKLAAKDGPIGKVKDFLFDDTRWTIRWMVADTGKWLPKRKVLISPVSIGEPDWKSSLFPVRMTKNEIESAPGLNADQPVSRQYEEKFFDYNGWPYYWNGAGVMGGSVAPPSLLTPENKAARVQPSPESGTHVLRSINEVTGYNIQALDGEIGHVEDFLMDGESWTLRYMVVDTRNWLPGRKVLIAPDWIDNIRWAEQKVAVSLNREAVKNSPEYKPSVPVNREYEARLYDFYDRPVYWI